jgi:hypothetical protein
MNTGFPAGQTSFGFPKTQNTPNTGYGSMPNFGAPNPPFGGFNSGSGQAFPALQTGSSQSQTFGGWHPMYNNLLG